MLGSGWSGGSITAPPPPPFFPFPPFPFPLAPPPLVATAAGFFLGGASEEVSATGFFLTG